MNIVTFDFVGMLANLTGKTGWTEMDGPDSRCGLDYYYRLPRGASEAYINVDQDSIVVTVDAETVYTGSIDDEEMQEFIE